MANLDMAKCLQVFFLLFNNKQTGKSWHLYTICSCKYLSNRFRFRLRFRLGFWLRFRLGFRLRFRLRLQLRFRLRFWLTRLHLRGWSPGWRSCFQWRGSRFFFLFKFGFFFLSFFNKAFSFLLNNIKSSWLKIVLRLVFTSNRVRVGDLIRSAFSENQRMELQVDCTLTSSLHTTNSWQTCWQTIGEKMGLVSILTNFFQQLFHVGKLVFDL